MTNNTSKASNIKVCDELGAWCLVALTTKTNGMITIYASILSAASVEWFSTHNFIIEGTASTTRDLWSSLSVIAYI
jgi:hypothetical protein